MRDLILANMRMRSYFIQNTRTPFSFSATLARHYIIISLAITVSCGSSTPTHLYPVRIFNNVDFPAPEGPIIAVSSLDRSLPLTDLRIVFTSENEIKLLNP